jgi:hypothetical protein
MVNQPTANIGTFEPEQILSRWSIPFVVTILVLGDHHTRSIQMAVMKALGKAPISWLYVTSKNM